MYHRYIQVEQNNTIRDANFNRYESLRKKKHSRYFNNALYKIL